MTAPSDAAVFRPVNQQGRSGPGSGGPLLVAPSSATDGEFGIFEIEVAAGAPPVTPHYHSGFTESFYVLDGAVGLRLGHEEIVAGPGDFAFVPRNGLHGFRNAGDGTARLLIIFTPGIPREEYFRELGELYRRPTPPTRQEIDAVALRHDQVNVHDD
jgi:quercetin dioxygenase-like cupin family protein